MTTAENLNRIIKAKSDIKQAIENKGVTVGDMTIDGYAAKINEIPQEVTGGGKWVVPDGTKFSNSTFVTFDGSSLDVSNLTTFQEFFSFCSNLTTVGDLSGWDVSNATDLAFLFSRCSSLKSVDTIKDWDVSNVVRIVGLFAECSKLSSVQAIKDWDVSNVVQLGNLFDGCSNLTSIDLSSWRINAKKILGVEYMFRNCTSLIEVKMGFDVSKIDEVYSNISTMFEGVETTGIFYYNSEYDYSKIIAVLPSTWTAVPM